MAHWWHIITQVIEFLITPVGSNPALSRQRGRALPGTPDLDPEGDAEGCERSIQPS